MARSDPEAQDQLALPLDTPAAGQLELPARLPFPMATGGGVLFDDDSRFFEPWWPGTPAFLRRDGSHIDLHTEHLSDPLTAFPELRDVLQHLAADGVIIEGTLLALDADGRPDQHLLRQRLADPGAHAGSAEGAFVAADLPYLEGHSLTRLPFVERRRRLASVLHDSDHCVLGRGIIGEGRMLGRAVASLGLHAVSARRLDARWKGGDTGGAWLRLAVTPEPTSPTRPFLVLMERLPLGD